MKNSITTSDRKIITIYPAATSTGASDVESDLSLGAGAILDKYKNISESEVVSKGC
jgi:hypothetical protein